MDYSICKALSYNMEDIEVALVMYDIMCQYRVNFQRRVANSPELSIPSSLELRTVLGCSISTDIRTLAYPDFLRATFREPSKLMARS